MKKIFLKISQNLQQNHCAGAALSKVLSCEFCKICKNTSLTEHFWTTTLEYKKSIIKHRAIEGTQV